MPDQGAPVSLIQSAFSTGEISPKLYGRTDLQKYHSGVAYLRNWYVDYQGGVTTRPGTQFIGRPGSSGYARLIPFQFSPTIGQTYMLVFSDKKLRFIKNPGGSTYPNSSNSAFIESSPGAPYTITTPYAEADLRSLHFLQVADVMRITAHGYARYTLTRVSDTNWTLAAISSTPAIGPPTISAIEITALPAGSSDPEDTRYMYCVSSVDADGSESLPSVPFISGAGINMGTTAGTVSVFWGSVANAVYYKVYKALPTQSNVWPNPSEQFGFAGFAYGTAFTDSNIIADFARAPLMDTNPFNSAGIIGYTISASTADWPVGSTTITVTDGTGTGAVVYPVLNANADGDTGSITGLYIARPGSGYSATPTITAGGGGVTFTAAAVVGASTGVDPDVVGLVQQRIVYASTANKPNSIFAARPGGADDFRQTNPVLDSDAFEFAIASTQVNDILWLHPMPGGLVIGTNSGIVQLTGGSSSPSNPAAITPTNAVIVPQSNYGTIDVPPVVIDYDILFVTPSGTVIDLQYNFFVNIFTGTDITVMSSHLFENVSIVEWAYQDSPRKCVWGVRGDGQLLSLTYFKSQEIMGWAHHDTNGVFESIASVQEGNEVAVYVSVRRFGNASRFIERMCGSLWNQVNDAWQLDCALSIAPVFPAANIALSAATGTVTITADAAVFAAGDVGKVITAVSSRATVTGFTNTTHVTALVDPTFPFGVLTIPSGTWQMNPKVASVSGLSHLAGQTVYALADGAVQGPFTVSVGGLVALTTPAAQVVIGLQYSCLFQPLYLDVGGDTTVQGRRKKVAAASFRLRTGARVKYGTSFSTVQEWVAGRSSTDPELDLPYHVPGLYTGDQRIAVDQVFTVGGWVCAVQDYPLPATILAVIPEFAQGDTR